MNSVDLDGAIHFVSEVGLYCLVYLNKLKISERDNKESFSFINKKGDMKNIESTKYIQNVAILVHIYSL